MRERGMVSRDAWKGEDGRRKRVGWRERIGKEEEEEKEEDVTEGVKCNVWLCMGWRGRRRRMWRGRGTEG